MRTAVPLYAVACGVAAVLSLNAGTIIGALAPETPSGPEVGTTLIYEIESLPKEINRDDIPKQVVKALNWRVNPGWWPQARIGILDHGRIEIGIYGNDAAKAQRIERILERTGTLEFRILANERDHGEIIKRARSEKGRELRDGGGQRVAHWVPAAFKKDSARIASDPGLTTRSLHGDEHEVLIIDDDYDVTDDCLKQASQASTRTATPPCFSWSTPWVPSGLNG